MLFTVEEYFASVLTVSCGSYLILSELSLTAN